MTFPNDVVVVGGCGHVGLPLGIALAAAGKRVVLFDIDPHAVDTVSAGKMPFMEPGGQEALEAAIASGRLMATVEPQVLRTAEVVIVVIGTPVDEHLNPSPEAVPRAIGSFQENLIDGQLLVLRSTIYPGVTAMVERRIAEAGLKVDVAFCPERIAEGKALEELSTLPQIVSGRSEQAVKRATDLFRTLTDEIVVLSPEEAELAKLFTNTWRYIKFAAANQLFMMANDFGLDFERIRQALAYNYPRAADLPAAGLAAGPCLFKDTMQLAAFNNNQFHLGHASMMVNEGLPLYLVARMSERWDLSEMTVGILGMAFKSESDDIRSSLSYKLKRILGFRSREVLTTDPYVKVDPDLRPLEDVLERADILVVGAPHAVYRALSPAQPVVDVWNVFNSGVRI